MEGIEEIREKVFPLLDGSDIDFAGIFGSFSRGAVGPKSDVDILVRFKTPKSLLTIAGLELELAEILGRKVDLVTEGALCPHIKEDVMKDLRPIYERQ